MRRRYESHAKRASPANSVRPSTEASLRPTLRTVSIIPGMENFAPERTDTSSGSWASPRRRPRSSSRRRKRHRDLYPQLGRQFGGLHVRATRIGGDREAWGHRQADIRHLGKVCALAPKQILEVPVSLAEVIDELLHNAPPRASAGAIAGTSSVCPSIVRFKGTFGPRDIGPRWAEQRADGCSDGQRIWQRVIAPAPQVSNNGSRARPGFARRSRCDRFGLRLHQRLSRHRQRDGDVDRDAGTQATIGRIAVSVAQYGGRVPVA